MVTTETFDERRLDDHRAELTGYCHRILGSASEAEDAVQETLIRAWRHLDRFEGRAAIRAWIYRIATNVCFDMINRRQRRPEPIATDGPDGPVLTADDDPAEWVVAQESVRLALITALHHLPPRQRAVLILRDVLRWTAAEVAELLGTTTTAVTSALQRARTTLAARPSSHTEPDDPIDRARLARYVDAFGCLDIEALTTLLHHDATAPAARHPSTSRKAHPR